MAKLIEPRVAVAVARRVANDPARSSIDLRPLITRLDSAVPRAEALVAEVSGIPSPPPVRWDVISRARWVEANVSSLVKMLKPLADKVAARLAATPWPLRMAQRGVVSVELGVLLGYISRRVLGQYDVLVPDEPGRGRGGAPLYFVGVNLLETQRRLDFVPDDFALWVAVHEVTHRYQFAGVPWLKPHFFGLLEGYLASVEIDSRVLSQRLATAARRVISGRVPPEERNPVYLLASDEQKAALNRIQALMAVVEGHGNFVMDAAGSSEIPSFQKMRAAFEGRRKQTNVVQRIVNNVIGLEMKLRQYELGQAFCEHVAQRAGRDALAHLWASPDHIPSLDELRSPELWLKRVA